jgi:hypothetical protein
MATTGILAITQMEPNQNNKSVTHNNAVDALEQAENRTLANAAVGAGPWTLSEAEFTRYKVFKASGASGAYNIVVPGEIGVTNNTKRTFFVWNADTADTATVKSDAAGTTVVLPPGAIAEIVQDHDDLVALTRFSTIGDEALPYDVGFYVSGKPGASANVMILVATRPFTLPDDFAGSKYFNGANPTGNPIVFDVQKNESSIGSISVTSGGVATFSTTGAGVSMAIGDRLKVVAPGTQDATCADISVVFRGARV